MTEKENLITLYIYEQNLLKSCTNKLLDASNEIVHDYILSIFDEIDEINRKLYNYLINNNILTKKTNNNEEKELLYEQLDDLITCLNK